jgi:thioredoxin reductase (NADPH)
VQEALRAGALRYCPVCDAYEVIDRAVGVYADGAHGVGEAIYLRHFTADLMLFMEDGADALSSADRLRLSQAGIACCEEPVRSIRHWNGQVTVVHGEHETRRDALYCALGLDVHGQFARALGASTDESGYVAVDAHHASDVEGLYAIGDVARGLNQIAVATGAAAIAASAMHRRLGIEFQSQAGR